MRSPDTFFRRISTLLGVFSVLVLTPSACTEDAPLGLDEDRESWTLVWEDQFDGSSGQLPSAANWRFDIGTGWGNQQLEFDTDRAENASLDGNGNLAITARQEFYQGSSFTSARITTQDLFEPQGGLIEARMQLPSGQGVWPAFWLLGANIETVPWPGCGEIDIMEYRGQEPSVVHGTLHGPGYSGGDAVTSSFYLGNDRFDTEFHVFSVEWNENSISWYVDGTRYRTVTREDLPGEWVFDNPFYIILNVAVGGTYVGYPSPATAFPQTMLVDWVRVYERGS
jgi:beta-glucanase (GH16 family)